MINLKSVKIKPLRKKCVFIQYLWPIVFLIHLMHSCLSLVSDSRYQLNTMRFSFSVGISTKVTLLINTNQSSRKLKISEQNWENYQNCRKRDKQTGFKATAFHVSVVDCDYSVSLHNKSLISLINLITSSLYHISSLEFQLLPNFQHFFICKPCLQGWE